jgi:FtsP/CotA-like multicopper oxidase with cupredoxin domain
MTHEHLFLGIVAALAVAGGAPTVAAQDAAAPGISAHGPAVPEPENIPSANGMLEISLTAKPGTVEVAGKRFISNVYGGKYIPPVLRLKRGDELRMQIVNEIGKAEIEIEKPLPTNLHYHGMAIPPAEPADYIYMLIPPAEGAGVEHLRHIAGADIKTSNVFEYRWTVPADHPPGLYWYHPHAHGSSEAQVLSGLSGLLVVEGLVEKHYPELARLKRRTFIFKDIELPGASDGDPKTKTINGVLGGAFVGAPGAFEVWELGNLGADSYIDLALDSHRFWVIERDGNGLAKPEHTDHVFLPPASRASIVVEGGAPGLYGLRTREVETGSAGDPNPDVVLATFDVKGRANDHSALRARMGEPAAALDSIGPTVDEVAALTATGKRRIVYTENAEGTKFYLNGHAFAMDRIDVEVELGAVEEWTLVNETDERHTFHIHQLDFLVQSVNGDPLETTGLRDNIDIPFRDPKTHKPGEVVVKIPFTNPIIVGKFPFHCHILEHEDGGMMANVRVKAP